MEWKNREKRATRATEIVSAASVFEIVLMRLLEMTLKYVWMFDVRVSADRTMAIDDKCSKTSFTQICNRTANLVVIGIDC